MKKSGFKEYDEGRRAFYQKSKDLTSEAHQQARLAMGTSKEDAYLRYLAGVFVQVARSISEVNIEPFSVWKGKSK